MKRQYLWLLSSTAILLFLLCAAGEPAPAGADDPLPPPHLGYGVNLRYLSNLDTIFPPLEFEWVKVYERFGTMPTERLPYLVLYRIDINRGDRWSWQGSPYPQLRPNLAQIEADVRQIAQQGLGIVDAYEIGNEPNMEWEWMNQPPDPADYVAVLQVVYETIKEVDPGAIVVSGGLGPVGRIEGACGGNSGTHYPLGNNCYAMDEREYARAMFDLGAGAYMDAFGYHPCGYAYPPEWDQEDLPSHDNGNYFAFRGVEVIRQIMVDEGLEDIPIWATEFGWLRDPTEDGFGWCHGDPAFAPHEWYDVPGVVQADYLTRSFAYADEHWPWMGAMFIWAFDFHKQEASCGVGRYFSIRRYNGDDDIEGATTPAYEALVAMETRPGPFSPRLAVSPQALSFTTDEVTLGVLTGTLVPVNTGYRVLTWTATVDSGMTLTPTLPVTMGVEGSPLMVTVDSADYGPGTYHGAITITTTLTDVLDAPVTIPITLQVDIVYPRLVLDVAQLLFLVDVDQPEQRSAVMVPRNEGGGVLTWTATVVPGMTLTPTLPVTCGLEGTPLTVTVDSSGYTTGTVSGTVVISATAGGVIGVPRQVMVTMHVVPDLHRVYLPVTLRHY